MGYERALGGSSWGVRFRPGADIPEFRDSGDKSDMDIEHGDAV